MADLMIRAGLLDRLKATRGILTDEAMADIGRIDLDEYQRIRAGLAGANPDCLARYSLAFGLSLGELVTPRSDGAPRKRKIA